MVVLRVVPRHAVGDHHGAQVAALDLHASEQTAVAVGLLSMNDDLLPLRQLGQPVAGCRAERLADLGGVDAVEADRGLLAALHDLQRVAVVDADDLRPVSDG